MLVPLKWLRDYVDIDIDTQEFADMMTMTGSKVEKVDFFGKETNGVEVCKILEIEQHPDADRLKVTKVEVANGEILQIVTNATNIKVGDYVNYTYDTVANYVMSSTTCGSTQNPTDGIPQTKGLKWRVLNIDRINNAIDLVSDNPTGTEVYFKGVLGYNNAPYFMNEICYAHYSNSSLGVYARNINLLDMEKQLTTTGLTARNAHKNAAQYGNTMTYTDSASFYPLLYASQKGAGINTTNVTQPDITKGNDPYDESKKIADNEPTTDSSTYQATSGGLTTTQTYYNIQINSDNYGDAADVLNNATFYWIAARCIGTYSDVARFGLRYASTYMGARHMMYSNGKTYERGYGLRPVVTIKFEHLDGTTDSSGAWNIK